MQKVVVVGGGILGCMISAALDRGGADVTQIRGTAERASDGSLVWLNLSSVTDPAYAALRLASMRIWQRLARDEAAPLRDIGALMWEDGLDCAAAAARLTGFGWPAEVVGRAGFRALAPGVAQPPETALWVPGEAACDPRDIMGWAEGRLGGVTRVAGDVDALHRDGDRVAGVRVAGEVIAADAVVLAAGLGCAPLLAGIGLQVPLRHAPGMLLRTQPVAPVASPVLASPLGDFWQDASGRLVIATSWDAVLEDAGQTAARASLEGLAGMMPAIGRPGTQTLVERQRPVPGDGLPLLGRLRDGCWLTLTHSGMTLAPVIAQEVTSEILSGQPAAALDGFRPERLIEGV